MTDLLIEYIAMFGAGAFLGLLFGEWAGRRNEARSWRQDAVDPYYLRRSGGLDYSVMPLDRFFQVYHNPLARAKFEGEKK